MATSWLTAIDLSDNELLNHRLHMIGVDPPNLEAKVYYNNVAKEIRFHNGTAWIALGPAGAGGPPTGGATGDLTGSYPAPQIAANVIVDADINTSANIAQSKISGLTTSLTGKVDTTRSVLAGNGLTGGGTLAADVTLNVVSANADMTVAADAITIVSAPKWTTGRTIALTGDVTGTSAAFDGTAALSFATAIGAGVIVDADVNASAAILTSKISGLDAALTARALTTTDLTAGAGLTGGGTLAANRTFAVGAGTGVTVNADDVALNLTYTDGRYVLMGGATMTGLLVLSADPSAPLGAATKQYVDLTSQGFSFKQAVRLVATTNQTLTGAATIDGIAVVTNDRVLCIAQTTTSQNGIWLANTAGAWTRSLDMDATGELVDGTLVPIGAGTAGADSQYMCTSIAATPWVPNSTASTWTRFSGVADLQAGAGLTKTGTTIDFVSATADMTVASDSVTIVSAPKWTTGRTIALTGDVTGTSGAFDGTAALSFATAIGAGVIVDADVNASANIATSKISGLDTALTGKVPTTRSVLAGNGMTGGGALSADVTLNVIGDANLSVTADLVSVLSAPKWTTARSITLTGDVTGTVASVDGTANVSIATTVVGVGTAAKHFAGDVGAGTAPVITHNLATKDVSVTVYRNTTPWDTVYCDCERTDTNNVTLRFATAVSAAAYRCVVQGR